MWTTAFDPVLCVSVMKRKMVIRLVYDVTRLRFGGERASSESVGASASSPICHL